MELLIGVLVGFWCGVGLMCLLIANDGRRKK